MLEFATAGQTLAEDGAPAAIVVRVTEIQADDVAFTFMVSGTAVDGVDFSIDGGGLLIPAGQMESTLLVTPLADLLCEPAETVVVTLLSATVVDLGTDRTHTITVLDEDTDVILESEPNDGVATANAAGEALPGLCLEIQGNIGEGAPDPFDVFKFTTGSTVQVTVELRPLGGPMDLVLFVTDATGALILPPVQNTGAGETEGVTFDVDSAFVPEFNLSVSVFGPIGDYAMRVTGASVPPLPLTAPMDSWAVDWSELKESLRPGRSEASPRPRMRLLGFGLQLDGETGSSRTGILTATR